MTVIEKSIEVGQPVRTVYNQWTQFESFPEFMAGVERVEQLNDTTLHWKTEIAGVDREFDADIVQQEPDQVIAWRAKGDEDHMGTVLFQPIDTNRTQINLRMEYQPEKWTDKVADAMNVVDRRVQGDLERFKSFIEERGGATGGWRGRVQHGVEQP